jgi:hypothetical protein
MYTLIRRLFGLQNRSWLFLEEYNILSLLGFETLASPARSRIPRQLSVLFLGAFAKCRKATISFVMPVRVSVRWNNSAPTGNIFMKFDIWVFLQSLSRTFKFRQNPTKITGTLREDQNTFLIITRSLLLRMRNVSDKRCRENKNTHFTSNNFFRKSCRLWVNVENYHTAG